MEIPVLLFGPQATLAGTSRISVAVHVDPPTAADVLSALREAAPAVADSLATSRLAVNHEFVTADHVVRQGDEVALIGMVSGG